MSKIIKKEYVPLAQNDTKATHLLCEVYYHLGGLNLFTYKEEARGYYISVSPVEREKKDGYTMESCVAFSGLKKCIKEVARQSKKAEKEALEAAQEEMKSLVDHVCAKNRIEAL